MNFVFAGLGGQGILFMTRVVAQATLNKGFDVLGAETHGMAQRGGSVISHLRIGNARSSLVRHGAARFLLALEEDEAYRNIPYLSKNGRMYVNTHTNSFPRNEVRPYLRRMGIASQAFSAAELAAELGAPRSSNLALLGLFSAYEPFPVSYGELLETIGLLSPDSYREINLRVFQEGFQRGSSERERSR